MAKQHANLLGLAITEKSVQIVETRGSGRSAKAGRRSTLPIDGPSLFDQPDRFGGLLAEHLKAEGYTTKHVAVGLCGRWVLARAMGLPPAEGAVLAGMVRLRLEGEYAGGQGDLCFDYQDAPLLSESKADDPSQQRGLLLVGMPRRRLEKLQQAMEAAGLRLESVGATPLDVSDSATDDGFALIVDPAGLSLTQRIEGQSGEFASTAYGTTGEVADAAAASQFVAAATRLSMTRGVGAGGAIALTDSAGLDPEIRDQFAQALSGRFEVSALVAADPALAAARRAGEAGTINLLDSKLAVAPARPLPPYAKWLIRAAVLLVLLLGVVGYLWIDANRELAALHEEYDTIRDSATRLQAVREDTRAASGWFDERPPVLDCLLELTHTFPKRGRIWVTSLRIDPDATGTVSCRADNEGTMWLYVNAMNASPSLTDVVLRRQNDAGRQASEIVFDVSFRYRESDRPAQEAL